MINSLLTWLVYPKKRIGTNAILFKYIKYSQIDRRTLKPSASNFGDENLSCDWDRYSTAEETRVRIGKQFIHGSTSQFKNENEYFVCRLKVEKLLNLDPKQLFIHDPIFNLPEKKGIPNNQSHSLIVGKKEKDKAQLKARGQLAILSEWAIFDENEFNNFFA